MNYIIKTGTNGGSSVISIKPSEILNLDLGIDKNIRIVYQNKEKSYPIIEILEADDDFIASVEKLRGYANV